jgi:hypothetical protein
MPLLSILGSASVKAFGRGGGGRVYPVTSTFTQIGHTGLSGNQASVSFLDLNLNYTDLYLIVNARTDYASPKDQLLIQMNLDTTAANYSSGYNIYDGTNASGNWYGTRTITTSGIKFPGLTGANATGTLGGALEIDFINFSSSTRYKTVIGEGGMSELNATSPNVTVGSFAGSWMSLSACTSITLKPFGGSNFTSGSSFTLYGVTRYGGYGS